MANPITQQAARKVLKKLHAQEMSRKGDAHPKYAIYDGDMLLATTGLRHSSNNDIPVPHVAKDLGVGPHFVLEMARCTKEKKDWLRKIGK